MSSKVSVIIPTYNHSQYVCRAIDSILAQTYKDYEVIVVDDGSTDGTREVLSKYGNKINYIYQENKGLPSARNTGIKASTGEYFVFLDADDYISPKALEIEVRFLENHPQIGWVYSDYYCVNKKGNILAQFSKGITSDITPPEGMVFKRFLQGNFVPINAVMIRKRCVNDVGFFDESLTSYEDGDFWLRVSAKYELKYINEPLAFQRMYAASMRTDLVRLRINTIQVINKICRLYPDLTLIYKNKINKNLADIHNYLGFEYYHQGKLKEAKSELLSSVRYYPFQKKVYFYLFLIFMKSFRLKIRL